MRWHVKVAPRGAQGSGSSSPSPSSGSLPSDSGRLLIEALSAMALGLDRQAQAIEQLAASIGELARETRELSALVAGEELLAQEEERKEADEYAGLDVARPMSNKR